MLSNICSVIETVHTTMPVGLWGNFPANLYLPVADLLIVCYV